VPIALALADTTRGSRLRPPRVIRRDSVAVSPVERTPRTSCRSSGFSSVDPTSIPNRAAAFDVASTSPETSTTHAASSMLRSTSVIPVGIVIDVSSSARARARYAQTTRSERPTPIANPMAREDSASCGRVMTPA